MIEHMLKIVSRYHFGRAYGILESYDYQWVDGDAEKQILYMCNLSNLKFVRVTGNKYFGCTAELVAIDKLAEDKETEEMLSRFIGQHLEIFKKAVED